MFDTYVSIINANGGKMTFAAFVDKCHEAHVDARLWLRAKHAAVLNTWLENGVLMIATISKEGLVTNA